MSKSTGLGQRLYLGGNDLSGDIQSVTVSGGPALLDVTDITQSAYSRLGGLRDGKIGVVSYWDTALAHPVLSLLPTADQIVTYATGVTIGSPAVSCNGRQINYDGTRGTDGSYTFAVEVQADGFGVEWGVLLTPGVMSTGVLGAASSFTAASFDTGGSLSFGAQMYVQVFGFVGTDATVLLQDSADNSAWTNLASMSQVISGANTTYRVAISNAATVRRYLRTRVSTTAGLTDIDVAVQLTKNLTAGQVF